MPALLPRVGYLLVAVLLAVPVFALTPAAQSDAIADGRPDIPSNSAKPPAPAGDRGTPKPAPESYEPPVTSGSEAEGAEAASLDVIRDRHGFAWPWSQGIRGGGVTVAVVEDGVDIGHPDLVGRQAVVTDPSSPYFGWPIAYDPKSMATYLATNDTEGTWYADTSVVGTSQFEETHSILVDGEKDFGETEKRGDDPPGQSAGDPDGKKDEYDLTDLYLARDADNWYFGFTSQPQDENVSFAVLIDVDNETSGSVNMPEGKLVDTATAHSDSVNDVAFDAAGTRIATVGSDRVVRVWTTGGALDQSLLGHSGIPMSVAWSPTDPNTLASADATALLLWDVAAGTVRRNIPIAGLAENGVLDFSPNGTWVSVSRRGYIHLYDAASGNLFGTIRTANADVNSARFSPNGTWMAATVANFNGVTVFALNATTIQPGASPATPSPSLFLLGAPHNAPTLDARWSPNGQRLIASDRNNRVVVWNVIARTSVFASTAHASRVRAVEFSPNNLEAVSVSEKLGVVLPSIIRWDAVTGAILDQVNMTNHMNGVDWSGANQIVTASTDLTARIFDAALNPLLRLVAHKPDYVLMALGTSTPDGSGGYDHRMEIATLYSWNAGTSAWDGQPLVGGTLMGDQASAPLGLDMFNEFAVPRSALGDPNAVSVILVSMGANVSKAQDTADSDPNVGFLGLDFSPTPVSIGAFRYHRHPAFLINGLTSATGEFHFGTHPSPILQRRLGAVGVLVYASGTGGSTRYDTVAVDLNADKIFDASDVILNRASPAGALDNFNASIPGPGQDGVPDISAGMVYFIADGQNSLPYANVTVARTPTLPQRIPADGDLVAFIGEFKYVAQTDTKEDHGTLMASAILGQGTLANQVNGTAPQAKLVVIGNGEADPEEAWYFSVQGYDGVPGTADDAQVVLTPFNAPTTREDGYDALSRTLDWIATRVGQGRSLFVVSAGDYGFGYGTVASPASAAAAFTVGQAADYTDRSSLYGGPEGPNPSFGDVQMTSARGPVALGIQKPELVAIGRGTLDIPLLSAADGTVATTPVPWTGTDLSAAVVAGAAALVYQAYKQDTLAFPDSGTVRRMLMAGADDLYQDPLTQGAGFLNATRSVRLARGDSAAGILPSVGAWHPGDYRGNAYDAFTRLVFPGTTTASSIQLQNVGSATSVTVSDAVFTKIGEYNLANLTRRQPPYATNGDIVFWVNDTGVTKWDVLQAMPVPQVAPIPGIWAQADLVKVTAFSDYTELVEKLDETSWDTNYSYNLKAYDWAGHPRSYPWPTVFQSDVNLLAETVHQSNLLEVRVHQPSRLHEGLVVHLQVPVLTNSIADQYWEFTVEFYRRADWEWLSLSPTSMIPITAGGSQPFTATLNVPPNAALGSYEAVILVDDVTRGLRTTIPVLANVAGNAPNLDLGGNTLGSSLYDNSRVYGGYDHKLQNSRIIRPYLGDWRYFYFDAPDQGLFGTPTSFKMMGTLTWDSVPGDIDVQVYGQGSVDTGSDQDPSRYGPYTLKVLGKSEESDRPELKTASGANEEVVAWDFATGLNVIALHGNIVTGQANNETFGGSAGWLRTTPSLNIVTNDLAGEGEMFFLSSFDYPGLSASAVGPATSRGLDDMEVKQDWEDFWSAYAFSESLARGSFTYIVRVEKALIFEVSIEGHGDALDLDMGVFRNTVGAECVWDPALLDPYTGEAGYWTGCDLGEHDPVTGEQNGNDKAEYLDNVDCRGGVGGMSCGGGINVNYDADGDANERVKWVSPLDGFYYIQVLGFTVISAGPCDRVQSIPCGHFDLDIGVTLATGKGYQIREANAQGLIVGTETGLPAFTPVLYHLAWDFPGDAAEGGYGGAILLGTPRAPGILVLSVVVTLDFTPPEFQGAEMIVDDAAGSLGSTVTDRTPQFVVTAADPSRGELEPLRFRVTLDGADVTPIAAIDARFTTVGGASGRWQATILYTPVPLADGVHVLTFTVEDLAGNVQAITTFMTVDSTAPPLTLDPLAAFTRDPTVRVTGSTAPGAWVTAGGDWVAADGAGRFALDVPLTPGSNRLAITAADWLTTEGGGVLRGGNTVTAAGVIVLDTLPPVFENLPSAVGRSVTREEAVMITGRLRDPWAASEEGDPRDLTLLIGGRRVAVHADGRFEALVPIAEGVNNLFVSATDAAGNAVGEIVSVTRDTVAPAVTLPETPERVHDASFALSGTTEPGNIVSVNGNLVAVDANGVFARDLELSPGLNQVDVRVTDGAGNENTARISLVFELPPRAPGVNPLLLGVLAVLALVGGLLGGMMFQRYRSPPGEAAPPPPPEPVSGEEPPPAAPAPPPPAPTADDKAARLEKAYRDGRITREVYERNLASLQAQPPAAESTPAEQTQSAPADPRLARLEKALADGKITREVYEENVRKLKGQGNA